MDDIKGKLSREQLEQRIRSGEMDTVIIAYVDHYGQLLGKRLTGEFFLKEQQTAGCNYVLTADIEMDPLPGFTLAGWEQGFGDFLLLPDLYSIRELGWRKGTACIIADLAHNSRQLVPQSPRTVLKRQLRRYGDAGMTVKMSSELEFYLFDTPYRTLYESGPGSLVPASCYSIDYHILGTDYFEDLMAEIRKCITATGIPVESGKGETGSGQYEIALEYAKALDMADRHVLFKYGIKSITQRHGSSATFMAKYTHEDSGSSCHIHLSLWDDENNLFTGDTELCRHFLAGLCELSSEMFLFYAPTVNYYKRYCTGSFAPLNATWDYDNRTVGYRLIGSGSSYRIENRFPGADVNPYLSYAAMLGAGMYGIEHKLPCPEPTGGSAYQTGVRPVPRTLEEAADMLDGSDRVRAILGDDVVDHYVHHARLEAAASRSTVHPWEVKRYFERI